MGLTGKMVDQIEIKAVGDLFHESMKYRPHSIDAMSPEKVVGFELHEGHLGTAGCCISWHYTHEKLTQVLVAERDSEQFQPLPFHYVEISRLLFDHARDDISDMYMVRSLIEDIKDVRFHKIGTGLEIISKERTYVLRLKNLSAMEANIVRPFVTRALGTFYKLSSPELIHDSGRVASRQPHAVNRGPRRQLRHR